MAPENKIPFSEIVDKLIEKSGQPEHTVHTFLASLFDQLSVDAEQNNETSLPNLVSQDQTITLLPVDLKGTFENSARSDTK